MSDEKNAKRSEPDPEHAGSELDHPRPGTPSDWIADVELHVGTVRRVLVRYARAKGAFIHAEQVDVEPGEITGRLKVWLHEDGAEVQLEEEVSPQRLVEHLWSSLCDAGLAYSVKHDLKRIRGEMELRDATGTILNEPRTNRKHLILDSPGGAWVGEDDEISQQDASLLGLLRFERQETRRLSVSLRNHQERDESRSESRFEHEKLLRTETMNLSQNMIQFAQFKEKFILAKLEEEASNNRIDMIAETITKLFEEKGGQLMDASMVWMRTGGGRRVDGRQVPEVPNLVRQWVMSTFGPEGFTRWSGEVLKAEELLPDEDSYTTRWGRVLDTLDESLKGVELSEKVAQMLAAWGNAAVETLKVDPHTYSRICFAKATEPGEELDDQAVVDQGAG